MRQNYEQYGHPDGKQEFSMGIALPKWIVESQNNGYVLGVYGLLFGVLMPWFVGSWWYGSKRFTKDAVLAKSADLYFKEMKEDLSFAQAVEILAASVEFSPQAPKGAALRSKKEKEFNKLEAAVKDAMKQYTPDTQLAGSLYRKTYAKKAAVFIYAHLLRVPIDDLTLLKGKGERHHPILCRTNYESTDKSTVVEKASTLCTSMMNIALAHSWLGAYLTTGTLLQHMVQGFHPALSPLLQLPNVSVTQSEQLASYGAVDFASFVQLSESKRREALKDMSDNDYRQAVKVAENFPVLEVIEAKFQGE